MEQLQFRVAKCTGKSASILFWGSENRSIIITITIKYHIKLGFNVGFIYRRLWFDIHLRHNPTRPLCLHTYKPHQHFWTAHGGKQISGTSVLIPYITITILIWNKSLHTQQQRQHQHQHQIYVILADSSFRPSIRP